MTFLEAASHCPFLLADGGIETRIAFETEIPLDSAMGVARLIEDDRGRSALEGIYRQVAVHGRRCVAGLPPDDPVPQRPLRGQANDEHFRAEGFLTLF